MKKKLNLSDLKIDSFITALESENKSCVVTGMKTIDSKFLDCVGPTLLSNCRTLVCEISYPHYLCGGK